MKSRSPDSIVTFEQLRAAQRRLKDELKDQEESLLKNPLVTIPTALFQGGSLKSSISSSMEAVSFEQIKKTAISLISTALMANRRTRKFFVAFVIAKEMVPFVLEKVNEHLKKA
jgi:hypothetical protein